MSLPAQWPQERGYAMIGGVPMQPVADYVERAFTWWLGELRGLVPRRLRERRRNVSDAEIRFGQGLWILHDRQGQESVMPLGDPDGLAEACARIRGRRRFGRVTLVVPLARCFTRRSEIPRRMMSRASAILASELEIGTPFQPGTAHWDWFAAEQGPGTIVVQQVVLKRRATEDLAAALAEQNVAVVSIAVTDGGGRRLPLDLCRSDRRGSVETADLRGGRRLLAGAAVAAGLAIVPAAFSKQSATLSDLDAAIAEATDAVALRPGLARAPLEQIGEALKAKRNWPATAVLDGLAASLPADSHLDHIFVERDVITIQGRAASVHNLERSFAASRIFTSGHNTAPAEATGDSTPFTLRLKMRPVPRGSEA